MDLAQELEHEAQRRFVRWDTRLWKEIGAGPALDLVESLRKAGAPEDAVLALVSSYLRLACEGIGLGYLFPSAAGADSFFTQAWLRLIPKGLAGVPAARRGEVLASCWNLGENLEAAPVWLRRIFLRTSATPEGLADLESLVADVSRQALSPPARRLAVPVEVGRVPLGDEDPRFLPGNVHFLAPTVVCVHDRLRIATGGRDAATMGVWLSDPPITLGPMACRDSPEAAALPPPLLKEVERLFPGETDWRGGAANEWHAALTLETSQFLVALRPK